ncbi:MAG TPA: TRAM domain-containing protein [Gemmatimonadaceae bacterium]|nr:TRAM domain-containing protein [Gemmatimonadaceae bacterium]
MEAAGNTSRVTIASIAAGGDGVGRVDGLAVFVPRTAPGDVVEARVVARGRFARGRLVRVLEAGTGRTAPRCPHYVHDHCGGCQLQHLDYAAQLDAKRGIVRDAMQRIARRDTPLPEITPSPSPWAYRAKLTLTMRWTPGEAGWTLGLHAHDDPARIFQLRECPITDPAVVAAWQEVQAAADLLPRERELRGAVRRVGPAMAFVLEGGTRWDRAREFARRCPSLHVVRWHPVHDPPVVIQDHRASAAPAAAFEQVNPAVAALLRDTLLQRALAVAPRHAVDAYAGHGETARMLARHAVAVTAIEVDREAARHAAVTLPEGSRVLQGRVEDVIDSALPADVVILNPPRAGVDARVAAALSRPPWPRLVLYVSCDPATLARDVGRLTGYQITHLHAFDMFPQTAHVETLCELTPVNSEAA